MDRECLLQRAIGVISDLHNTKTRLTDAKGGDFNGGFVVMEVPFANATDEQQALKIGIAIRNELQSEIASKAALYQR